MAKDTYVPSNLIAGETSLVSDSITLASGENIKRGAVLGKVTTGGKFKVSLSAASDGSENPVAIAIEDVDATGADVTNVGVYIKGEFNARALIFGTGHTVDSAKDKLRAVGIYVKDTVAR